MTNDPSYKSDPRIEKIYEQLIRYSTGDFSARETVSERGDELDAIVVGLNTIGEELQSSGRALQQFETRINALLEVLIGYIRMDFSARAEVTEAGDELDAIAVGLNTLAEELKAARDTEALNLKRLEENNALILQLNNDLQDNLEKLEHSNRELEAFTYSVSHDLRAPLRAIHSYTRILSEDYMSGIDAEGKEMMEAVMRNAKKMGQLIDDLLAFSRVGKKELVFTQINMQQLVREIFQEMEQVQPHQAIVSLNELPPLNGDRSMIHLVMTNLISNALKYSSAKQDPEVEVGCERQDNRMVYYVRDNGAGFDMKYYNKLFGVFQRLHAANEFEGTGVGLALVNRIISRHNGEIWASAKLNKGATFYFTINT